MLSAFFVLLGRHTGQQDVVIGTPVAGRGRREIEGLIGGTTAGPQWKRARLPPAGGVEARGAAGGGAPAGGGVRITLVRLVV
jgi:hypothetical protein